MATDISPPTSAALSRRRLFGSVRIVLFLVLCASLVICAAVSWITRDAMAHLPFLRGSANGRALPNSQKTLVDLGPWLTAQALAPLAVTSEEIEHAREAEHLADHEVDQAFASALRLASTKHHVLTGEALVLSQRVAQLQGIVKDDQAAVKRLAAVNGSPATTEGAPQDAPSASDLEVAKAQLGLDSDELTDAQRDLARASGDEGTRIREELAAHELAMSKTQTDNQGQVAILSAKQHGTLASRLRAWMNQRSRYQLIQQAMQQAQSDIKTLTAEHDALEARANADASPSAQHAAQGATGTGPDTAARLSRIKVGSEQRQILGIYDDRIQTQQQLAAVYGKWSAQVRLQHRIVLHLIMQQLSLIAIILLGIVFCDALVNRLLEWPGLDHRRMQTLRIVIKLSVQIVGLLLILLVVFGVPQQMPTILGLTTAGLTVVFQDFILAFFGWFVLMGKKGIRVGDTVEINGVAGEVTDISLFRTTLLETGNWTDKGHPTGRRVTFTNNFSISGQYFNFSTIGQWMWDEISVNIPTSGDAYGTIEQIHKAILKETEADARLAEQEWKRTAKQNGLRQFSASPAVDLRPAASGIDILARYVTRASDRFSMRNRLYQCIIEVLHKPPTFESDRQPIPEPIPEPILDPMQLLGPGDQEKNGAPRR